MGQFSRTCICKLLSRFLSNLVCRVAYMEGIKYVNLIEIGLVVIEIWGIENSKLPVPVNNTLVCYTAFLAADTWLCILISDFIRHQLNYMAVSNPFKNLSMYVHNKHQTLSENCDICVTNFSNLHNITMSYLILTGWYL